jgi:hypothetical protein
MRTFQVALVLVASTTSLIHAQSLEKAYFDATEPGAWAKYESSWEMPDGLTGTNISTYIRVPDSEHRVRIELDIETVAGPGAGMVSRQLHIMASDFDLATNFLNYSMFTEASFAQTGDAPPSRMQDNVLAVIRESAGDLTNSVTFQGRTSREGRDCDLYAYSYHSGGPQVTRHEGEICLDETLPFGVVHQRGRVTSESGELTSSFDQKLLETGAGASGSAALLAVTTPEAGPTAQDEAVSDTFPSLPLLDAYQSEKVRLMVQVVDGSGGRRLDLTVVNTTDEPLDLVVPEGAVTIPADSPLGVLNLHMSEKRRFSLAPGGSSPEFSVGQPGSRGAKGGTFQLTVYEGQPLFQGSVEVGPIE